MAVQYSEQYQDLYVDTLPTRVDADIALGQLQIIRFNFTNPSSGGLSSLGDQIYLCKVPPQCQIVVPFCYFRFSAWDTNTVLDIGHVAYKTAAGATTAAAEAALIDDMDVDAVGLWVVGTTLTSTATIAHKFPVVDYFNIRAQEPVTITATFRGAAPTASDTLVGHIAITIL